jgi:hypothetical protein
MTTTDTMAAGREASSVARWVAIGLALYLLLGIASLFATGLVDVLILAPLGIDPEAGTSSWGLHLASQDILWGLSVAGAAGVIGRRLVPGLRFGVSGLVVLAAGLTLAALTTFCLHESVRERVGTYFDPEYAGWAIFAAPAVVAVAVATWAALSLPLRQRGPLLLLGTTAGIALAAVMAPSLPGLADGVAPRSTGLFLVLAADAAFVILGLILGRR